MPQKQSLKRRLFRRVSVNNKLFFGFAIMDRIFRRALVSAAAAGGASTRKTARNSDDIRIGRQTLRRFAAEVSKV